MTAEDLAAIHQRAMRVPAPWSAQTIAGFLAAPGAILATSAHGFALGRVIVDEAELLTLAVLPEARRQGEARRCLAAFEQEAAARGAVRAFLEVAETNAAARSLYRAAGWDETGSRRAYYADPEGGTINAIVMSKTLNLA